MSWKRKNVLCHYFSLAFSKCNGMFGSPNLMLLLTGSCVTVLRYRKETFPPSTLQKYWLLSVEILLFRAVVALQLSSMQCKVSRVKRACLLPQNQIQEIIIDLDSNKEKCFIPKDTEDEAEPCPHFSEYSGTSVHEQIFWTKNASGDEWCLEKRTRKPATTVGDKLRVSAGEHQLLCNFRSVHISARIRRAFSGISLRFVVFYILLNYKK
jgi:hypothetical protein